MLSNKKSPLFKANNGDFFSWKAVSMQQLFLLFYLRKCLRKVVVPSGAVLLSI